MPDVQWSQQKAATTTIMTDDSLQPSDLSSGESEANSQRTAERSVKAWEAVARELVPLIGEKGFAILFARCVHLTRAIHPWFVLDPVEPGPACFAPLAALLAGQSEADARAANGILQATFNDTLAVLIGKPLATGILRNIEGHSPSSTEEVHS